MQLGIAVRLKRHSLTIANICSLGDCKTAAQTNIGDSKCLFKRKPSRLLAFTITRMRIIVTRKQQIAHVEVTVTARAGVCIHMDELRPVVRVRNFETKLFHRLAQRGSRGFFARVDMPARLQPNTEAFVHVQHNTATTDDDGRCGHVTHVGVFVERVGERRHDLEKLGDRFAFAIIYGCCALKVRAQLHRCTRSAVNHGSQGSGWRRSRVRHKGQQAATFAARAPPPSPATRRIAT